MTKHLFSLLLVLPLTACLADVDDGDDEPVEVVTQAFDDDCGPGQFEVEGGGHSWTCDAGDDCADFINDCRDAYGSCSVEACGFE